MLILPRRKPPLAIADVFSTDLWTGTGATQTITNGLDLSGGGGLVWIKQRDGVTSHSFYDTDRGARKYLIPNSTDVEATSAPGSGLTGFNADGFTLGTNWNSENANAKAHGGWSFRKAPSFFDVVTYTGTGAAQNISHNLGSVPGMIVVKRTDSAGGWAVYHRSNTVAPETDYLRLDLTNATSDSDAYWNDTPPTSSVFTVGSDTDINASGGTFVAYVFAHDDSSSGVIQCGSYTGNGSTSGPTVTLGWEPQFVMIKRTDSTGNWSIQDSTRGLSKVLYPDNSIAEETKSPAFVASTATGFQLTSSVAAVNASGGSYIYMAIRKEGA